MAGAGVVFDFDGTIVDSEHPVYLSWAEVWLAQGHELPLEVWQSIIGAGHGFDPAAELAARTGQPVTEAMLEARRARRDELLHAEEPRPGVLAWLDEADALGVPVAIASSSPPEWVDANLARLGLLHRFGYLACADGEVPAKPDPTSYRLACDAIGADPARSVAVEDSPNGIRAAADAGLFVVAVPHGLTEGLDLSAADVVLDDLRALDLADALARAAAR